MGREMYAAVLVVVCVALTSSVQAWVNDYDQRADFDCPAGQLLARIQSIHNNRREDRVWDFDCRDIPVSGSVINCQWSNYANNWDGQMTFQCPGEGFITGVNSYHHNRHEDRRFKFQCCQVQAAVSHGCYFTNWANDWDGLLSYTVPNGKIMRGVVSYHQNSREDRRFKFNICSLDTLSLQK